MTSPEFRRSTVTTTALIHSISPPGFVASEKDLSPHPKAKSENGCVVNKKDQIILLKRVYVSPARRSSRVHKKAHDVIPKSKVKHKYLDPEVCHQPMIGDLICNKKDPELAKSPSASGCTSPNIYPTPNSTTPVLTSPERYTSLSSLTEADFFRPDGTPRWKLTVRITETPEIRKKLEEIEKLQSPDGSENQEASFMPNLSSKDAVHGDRNVSIFTPLCKRFTPVDDVLLDTENVETLDNEFSEDQKVICRRSPSLNSKATLKSQEFSEVGMLHDSADEMLCISPTLFERGSLANSLKDATRKRDSDVTSDIHAPCVLPEFLPLQETPPQDGKDVPDCLIPFDESHCKGFAKSDSSAGNGTEKSTTWSEAAPAPREDLGIGNKSARLSYPLGKIKVKSILNMASKNDLTTGHVSVSLPCSELPSCANEVAGKLSDSHGNPDIDTSPHHRGHNNETPSPTCASQANSDSPCSPTFVGKHSDPELPSPWTSPTSPRLLSSQEDNFQDFSEFDFLIKGGKVQALFSSEAADPVINNQFDKHSPSNTDSKMQYANNVSTPLPVTDPSPVVVGSSLCAAQYSVQKAKSKFPNIKWNEMLESDVTYRESIGKSSDAGVDDQKASETDLSVRQFSTSSQKKRKEKVISCRSSFRIAKRLSLLSLEEELKRSQDENTFEAKQNSSSDALIDLSKSKKETLPGQRDKSPQESNVVSKSKKRNGRRSCKLVRNAPSVGSSQSTPLENCDTNAQTPDERTGLTSKQPLLTSPQNLPAKEKILQLDGNCVPSEEKPQRSKRQWRRRSVRLNPVQIQDYLTTSPSVDLKRLEAQPELHQTEQPHSKSTSKESVLLKELGSHSQETSDWSSTSSTIIDVQSKSDSLRLESSVLLVTSKDPVATESDALRDFGVMSQINIDSDACILEAKNSTERFAVGPSLVTADQITASTSAQDSTDVLPDFEKVPVKRVRRKRDYSKCKRRRSVRLLKLSMTNLEEELPNTDLNLDEQLPLQPSSVILGDVKSTDLNTNHSGIISPKSGCSTERFESGSSDDHGEDCGHDDDYHCSPKDEQSESSLIGCTGYSEESHSSCSEGESGNVDVIEDNSENDSQEPSSAKSSLIDTCSGENANEDWLVQIEEAASHKRPRRRSSILSYSKVQNIKLKKTKENDEDSVKNLYLKRGDGKRVKPSSLETIFEEAQFSKMGSPLYTGSKKCKRSVIFPEHPWLPRKKKKKIPSGKRGRMRIKNKDPSIDEKLEALLAEWTLSSPSSSRTCHGSQASNQDFQTDINQNSCKENGLGDKSNCNSLLYTCSSDLSDSLVSRDASNSSEEAKTRIKRECSTEGGEVEIWPKKPKRDTPFKGSKATGTYAIWFKSHLLQHDVPDDEDIPEENEQE